MFSQFQIFGTDISTGLPIDIAQRNANATVTLSESLTGYDFLELYVIPQGPEWVLLEDLSLASVVVPRLSELQRPKI